MPAIRTSYDVKPTPENQSIWLIIDDPPCDDLHALRKELQAAVGKVLEQHTDKNRWPQPANRISSGVVETKKLTLSERIR